MWGKRWWEKKSYNKKKKANSLSLNFTILLSLLDCSYLLRTCTRYWKKGLSINWTCRKRKYINFSSLSEHWNLLPKRHCGRGKYRWGKSASEFTQSQRSSGLSCTSTHGCVCGCIFAPLHRNWLGWSVPSLMMVLLHSQRLEAVSTFWDCGLYP